MGGDTEIAPKSCPLCGTTLQLKQINLTMAIYICVQNNCRYPVGGKCIVVDRKMKNLVQFKSLNQKISTDDNIIFKELLPKEEIGELKCESVTCEDIYSSIKISKTECATSDNYNGLDIDDIEHLLGLTENTDKTDCDDAVAVQDGFTSDYFDVDELLNCF